VCVSVRGRERKRVCVRENEKMVLDFLIVSCRCRLREGEGGRACVCKCVGERETERVYVRVCVRGKDVRLLIGILPVPP